MTDSTNPIDVDDVDQGPPIMRVVANADGTVSLTMAPADAAAMAGIVTDHVDRIAFGQSLHRIVHGEAASDVGSLRWVQLATDLLAARAELTQRVDVRFLDLRAGIPSEALDWIDDFIVRRPVVDVDITAATTPEPPTAVPTRESAMCPGQCGRYIRVGRLLCPSCWARVPHQVRAAYRRRLVEGRGGGWEDNHIRNHEAAKRAVLDAALGSPVDAEPQEPKR